MTKKSISELTIEELRMVFDRNEKLQNDVAEDNQDSAMGYVSEILDCFKGSLIDWSIDFYNRNYISVRDTHRINFLYELMEVQNNYCFLIEEKTEAINKLIDKIQYFYNMDHDNKQWLNLEGWIEKQFRIIKREVVDVFDTMTEHPSTEELMTYFIDFYAECRLDEGFYVDGDYILYQDIAYTKSYKSA